MKRAHIYIIYILVTGFFSSLAWSGLAQQTATGRISAEVVEVLTASIQGSVGTHLIATPETPESWFTQMDSSGRPLQDLAFTVSGADDETFYISLPEGPVTLTSELGLPDLSITDWRSVEPQRSGQGVSAQFHRVAIGGTLKTGSRIRRPQGLYMGSYQVTVAYN